MEYVIKLQQMGDPLSQDYQAAIFGRGLPEHMEGAVYTLSRIQRSKKEPIGFGYVTTSLENREVSVKTVEYKAFAGNFGKQPKKGQNQGQNQNSSGTKTKGQGNSEKCNFCGSSYHSRKSCFHAHPDQAPERFTSLTKAELEARKDRPNKGEKRPSRQQSKQNLDEQKQDKSYTARFEKQPQNTKSHEVIINSGDQEHAFWGKGKGGPSGQQTGIYYSAGNKISAALVGARVLLPRISVVDGMCDAGESLIT